MMRIVSLLPSATEIVAALGLQHQLVGVSHECDYPPGVERLPRVTRSLIPAGASSREIDDVVRDRMANGGDLYGLDFSLLESLRPTLILTQALCDVCAVAEEEVRAAVCRLPNKPRVINLQPQRLEDVLLAIEEVAHAAEVVGRGREVVAALRGRIASVVRRTRTIAHRPRVTVLEWIDPPFSSGHWTPELVEMAGGIEGLGRAGLPSESIPWQAIVDWQPEVLVIACCGFSVERTREDLPILERQPGYGDLPCMRQGRIHMVDGSAYFSRPGPRLIDTLEILAHLLHPGIHPALGTHAPSECMNG